jgi:autotransporter-associated beta strand protein
MRPGYLLPVHDLEAGQAERSSAELSQFAVDFSNRIYEVMGFRPIVYSSQNYANYVDATVPAVYPHLWIARWPQGSGNQFTGNLQTDNPPPSPSTANVYGEWNPNHTVANPYPDGHPWKFWQYSSGERLQSFNNGGSNLDGDVANGGLEFLKDHLVPALWVTDSSGDWNELSKWNSGQAPVAPPGDPNVVSCGTCPVGTTGQLAPIGPQTLPTPRLPGGAAPGITSGVNDTVILDRGAANPTITLSSGTHNIRKLYVREALNITGGSLTINYDNPKYAANDPLRDPASTLISAQFSATVSLNNGAALSVYRLQVDAEQTFTLASGTVTFHQIDLMSHSTTPARIAMTGDINFNSRENVTAAIVNGGAAGSSGLFDLAGAARTFNVANGTSSIDLSIGVPITNGGLTKTGLGTLALTGVNTYAGDTRIQGGTLRVSNTYLANEADVYLASGALLDLAFAGNDEVRSLYFDGVPQQQGIWGAPGSGAQFTSPLIAGDGKLYVGVTAPPPPPPPGAGPGNVLDDFEVNEGHFGWSYNLSPPSQVFGLSNATTIDRVTSDFQGVGVASQLLNLVTDGSANWQLRHNSGIVSAAQPTGNVPLAPTGSVGFWLKTDDPTASEIQIAIDDPVAAGATAIEKGRPLAIIADNQWHLYQWNFEDDDDWVTFNAGSNGEIDATNGTITIDSIWITGSGNVQLFLDTVSHNPNGLLAALLPGDYDRNGLVDAADYEVWRGDFGTSVPPGSGADGTNDGLVDVGDFLMWSKQTSYLNPGGGNSASTADGQSSVPEPGVLALIVGAAVILRAARMI